jgi:hypothetical protein
MGVGAHSISLRRQGQKNTMATNRIRTKLMALGVQFWLAANAFGQMMESDYAPGRVGTGDMDIGAPADLSLYGNYPKPNYGWWGKAEGIYFSISSPDTTTIGREGFNPAVTDGSRLIFQENTADTGWMANDFTWGNRLEGGYMGTDGRGWMVSGFKTNAQNSTFALDGDGDYEPLRTANADGIFTGITFAQGGIGVSFLPQVGPDGVSVLEGFVNETATDANGDTITFDADINNNGIFGRSGQDTGTPNQNPPPAFIPPPDGIPDTPAATDFGDLVYFPVYFEKLKARNESRMFNIEVMRVWRRSPFKRWGLLEIFGGARYLNFKDGFDVIALGGNLNPQLGTDEDYDWSDNAGSYWFTDVDNNIIGGQIGARLTRKVHRLAYIAEVRGFAGANFQNFDIYGRLGNGLLPGGGNMPLDLGDTNFKDSDNATEFVPGGELRFELNYQVTQAIQLQVGWTGMYFDGVARASNSIDYRIPDMQITTANNREDIFVQGVTFGVELNR